MRTLIATTLTLLLLVLSVQSFAQEQMGREGDWIVNRQPWPEIFSNEEVVRRTVIGATQAMQSILVDINEQHVLPEELLSMEDIEAMDAHDDAIEEMLDSMNEWIARQRERTGGEFSGVDALPDALVYFMGSKVGKKLSFNRGGSLMFGLVIVPQKVTKTHITTGEVTTGVGFSTTIVSWPSIDIGFEASTGKGPARRWGFGAIWDLNDAFTQATDFYGVGLGVSYSAEIVPVPGFATGVNIKSGILSQNPTEVTADIFYVTVAKPMAGFTVPPSASLAAHANFTAVISFQEMVGMVGSLLSSTQNAYHKETEKAIQKAIEEALEESQKTEESAEEKSEKKSETGNEA